MASMPANAHTSSNSPPGAPDTPIPPEPGENSNDEMLHDAFSTQVDKAIVASGPMAVRRFWAGCYYHSVIVPEKSGLQPASWW